MAPTLREPGLPRHQLTREDLEDKPARDYEATWGTWAGREEAFYVACAEHVGSLDRDAFVRVVDEPGAALLSAATLAYEAVATPKLAPRLVLNREMGVVTAAGGVGVTTYSRYDSLFLTDDLHRLLGQFMDEPLAVVVERLSREHEIEIPESLLLELSCTASSFRRTKRRRRLHEDSSPRASNA